MTRILASLFLGLSLLLAGCSTTPAERSLQLGGDVEVRLQQIDLGPRASHVLTVVAPPQVRSVRFLPELDEYSNWQYRVVVTEESGAEKNLGYATVGERGGLTVMGEKGGGSTSVMVVTAGEEAGEIDSSCCLQCAYTRVKTGLEDQSSGCSALK
jgi:hypothetical protein